MRERIYTVPSQLYRLAGVGLSNFIATGEPASSQVHEEVRKDIHRRIRDIATKNGFSVRKGHTLLTNLVAAGPGWLAARTRPAVTLRAE